MASRRFAALALLVAVAITAVHADWDDDNPCWGCSDGSCVEVQLNTTGITGSRLPSSRAGRKLMRINGDNDGDYDDWFNGTRRLCTQCATGYSLVHERAYDGVTAGECECDYANGYGKWKNRTMDICVQCEAGSVPLTCLSNIKAVYDAQTRVWQLIPGNATSCTYRRAKVDDWKPEKPAKRVKATKFTLKEKYCVACPAETTAVGGTCVPAV